MKIFTKTPEYKKIVGWKDNTIKFLIASLTVTVIAAALVDGRPIIIAAMLMILAAFSTKLTEAVKKMDLFKHNPDALQNKIINHLPKLIFLSACGLALLG